MPRQFGPRGKRNGQRGEARGTRPEDDTGVDRGVGHTRGRYHEIPDYGLANYLYDPNYIFSPPDTRSTATKFDELTECIRKGQEKKKQHNVILDLDYVCDSDNVIHPQFVPQLMLKLNNLKDIDWSERIHVTLTNGEHVRIQVWSPLVYSHFLNESYYDVNGQKRRLFVLENGRYQTHTFALLNPYYDCAEPDHIFRFGCLVGQMLASRSPMPVAEWINIILYRILLRGCLYFADLSFDLPGWYRSVMNIFIFGRRMNAQIPNVDHHPTDDRIFYPNSDYSARSVISRTNVVEYSKASEQFSTDAYRPFMRSLVRGFFSIVSQEQFFSYSFDLYSFIIRLYDIQTDFVGKIHFLNNPNLANERDRELIEQNKSWLKELLDTDFDSKTKQMFFLFATRTLKPYCLKDHVLLITFESRLLCPIPNPVPYGDFTHYDLLRMPTSRSKESLQMVLVDAMFNFSNASFYGNANAWEE